MKLLLEKINSSTGPLNFYFIHFLLRFIFRSFNFWPREAGGMRIHIQIQIYYNKEISTVSNIVHHV